MSIDSEVVSAYPRGVGVSRVAAWVLAVAISPRDSLRVQLPDAGGGFSSQYVGRASIDGAAPEAPWAVHLTDAAGLGTALFAAHLARRPVSATRTWGYARAEVLSATGQAAVLLAVGVFVIIEGVQRLFAPPEIASAGLLVFGVIGLLGNTASLLVLAAGRNANFNLRAAFLEVVNDALGSLAVILAAVAIAVTGWTGW